MNEPREDQQDTQGWGEEAAALTLEQAVELTRNARISCASLEQLLRQRRQAFEAEQADLLQALAEAHTRQGELEEQTRALALNQYRPGSSKQLYPGVSIREKIELHYDPDEAYQWACAGNSLAINPACLNVSVFEQLARRFPARVPFVRQSVTYQVLLSKQL